MNERLQKFLWIDDPRIRRWGRLNGMICLISGFIVMLLSPLFYLGAKIVGKLASEATSAYTSLLLEHLESGTKAYRIAYQMDKELPGIHETNIFGFPFALLLFGFGFAAAMTGILFLRLREVISEQGEGGNSE